MNIKSLLFPATRLLAAIAAIALTGCSAPLIKMPEPPPSIVRQHASVRVQASYPGLKKTGIHIDKGDYYTVLVDGKVNTNPRRYPGRWQSPMARLRLFAGDLPISRYAFNNIEQSYHAGEIAFVVKDGKFNYEKRGAMNPKWYKDNVGSFQVSVIIWEEEDYQRIAAFLEKLHAADPENEVLGDIAKTAAHYRDIQVVEKDTNQQVAETRELIDQLKAGTGSSKVAADPRVAQLESKLAALKATLSQLDEMKKQLAAEKEKSVQLTQQLEQQEQREKALLQQITKGGKMPPVIVVASPSVDGDTEAKTVLFRGVAEDDQGLKEVNFYLNNKPVTFSGQRGIAVLPTAQKKRIDFDRRIALAKGINRITIRAVDLDDLAVEKTFVFNRIDSRRNVWAVVIGINAYPNVPPLKYAVNDAEAFYRLLVNENNIPRDNITLLTNQQATLSRVRSTLGTLLKQKAGTGDMVIIYFAGHGATERDALSADGDGLEKYILTYDSKLDDLYASALPMREITHIFHRIRSERLVFIADACYSGASGGRTVGITGIRANISDTFLERLSRGKGRVILTASSTNEVSVENDDLQHGVFTYYLIEGLKGKADTDKDGLITVDEAYRYVSVRVRNITGQEQNPLKKGTVEGNLVLGIVK
ncbi:MAG: hypothetical protein AMJ54_12545 [Deltaproteobacteria bacterium SG8_13]|nr:MAG: hypothetical protein AMJ54_12545 [Deltaproteobacteria bacterium SG8_13]